MLTKKRTLKMFAKFTELLEDIHSNAEVVDNCLMFNGHRVPFVKVKGNIGSNLSFEGHRAESVAAYLGIEIREHLNSGDERILVGNLSIEDNRNYPEKKLYIKAACGTPKSLPLGQDFIPRRKYEVEGDMSYVVIKHHADESERETMAVIDNLFSAISKSKRKETKQKLSKLNINTKATEQSKKKNMEKKRLFISKRFARNMVNGDIRMNSTYYFDALDKDAVKNVGEAFIDFKDEIISKKGLLAVAQNHNLDFNCFVYHKPKTLKEAEKAEQFGPTPKDVESCVFTSKEKGKIFVQENRDIWELLAKDGNKKYQDLLERIDKDAARKIGKPYQGPTYMATPEREM